MSSNSTDNGIARHFAVIGVLVYSSTLIGLLLLAVMFIPEPIGNTIPNLFVLVLIMLISTGLKTLKDVYGANLMSFLSIFSGVVFTAVFFYGSAVMMGKLANTSLNEFSIWAGAVLVVYVAHWVSQVLVRVCCWRALASWV